ncbi:hypothetical protein PI125_g11621 [Phytophthora idaei]|nr:hypothetical protein PI125_g11621 [Phytophthora idaei]
MMAVLETFKKLIVVDEKLLVHQIAAVWSARIDQRLYPTPLCVPISEGGL